MVSATQVKLELLYHPLCYYHIISATRHHHQPHITSIRERFKYEKTIYANFIMSLVTYLSIHGRIIHNQSTSLREMAT